MMIPSYNQPWKLVQNRIRGTGGREIDKFRHVHPAVDDGSGSEAWIGSVTRVGNLPAGNPDYGCSKTILPDGREMYLYEAIALDPQNILGSRHLSINGESMGVLVKLLDAQVQYALQCHPSRTFAKKMWNSPFGKEESWYVIGVRDDTPEPAYIYLGFKEGVTKADWENFFYNDDIQSLENLCHRIEVKPGDAYFVDAGCPHALGAGCFVLEVQEPSDITVLAETYKVVKKKDENITVDEWTYNERLLGAYIFDGCDYQENLDKRRVPRNIIRRGDWGDESIVIGPEQTSYFSFTELTVNTEAALRDTMFPQIAVVMDGNGKIAYDGGEFEFKKADEIFLPYSIPNARVIGESRIILCHPPGVEY
ncbi:MAG: class I mannose-6-phosphate isomerase [Clostridiales bacterium]|jgi:mannose-6-phosphate isomerase|nr:class I mannose-6-phosphate isomerase [Clostridiales bacterium]